MKMNIVIIILLSAVTIFSSFSAWGEAPIFSHGFETAKGVGPSNPSSFYDNGQTFLDFIVNDGHDRHSASGAACDPDVHFGHNACFSGGEVRSIPLMDVTSCSVVNSLADALNAFDWSCDDVGGSPRALSWGFSVGKHMTDLIDFETLTWKQNQILADTGSGPTAASPMKTWYSAPIVELGTGLTEVLNEAQTVYVAKQASNTDVEIKNSKIALLIEPGVVFTGRTDIAVRQGFFGATEANDFLWFEGRYDTHRKAISILQSRFSTFRNLYFTGCSADACLNLTRLTNDFGANSCIVRDIRLDSRDGFINMAAQGCLVANVRQVGHGPGVSMSNSVGGHNTVFNIVGGNGYDSPVCINAGGNLGGGNNRAAMILAGNAGREICATGHSVVVNSVTTANPDSTGMFIASDNVTIMNAVAVNTRSVGLNSNPGTGLTIVNLASVHTGSVNFLNRQDDTLLQGFLIVGDNRTLWACDGQGTNSAVTYPDCESDGSVGAQFTLLADQNLATAFVGRLGINDLVNGSTQTNGTAAYDSITDWFTFEQPTRMWGTGETDAFPSETLQDVCETGETCAIWDWSLAGDSVLKNINTLPDAEDFVVQSWDADDKAACAMVDGAIWSDPDCTTTFLKHAVEVMFDYVGNDNTLCESGETCLFTPNIGFYQGHGTLVAAGTIGVGGTIQNVTLVRYATNGN